MNDKRVPLWTLLPPEAQAYVLGLVTGLVTGGGIVGALVLVLGGK